jgi:hypothetical protein
MLAWSRMAVLAACLALSLARAADEPAYRLDLKPAKGLPNGRVAALKAVATPRPDKFFIENAFVLQPVVVSLFSENPADVVKIRLGKDRWDEALVEGATGPDGKAILKLRTQGEVRISVSADEGHKPYKLLVWVGDEVKVVPEPAVMSMTEYRKANPEPLWARLGPALAWGAGASILAALIAGLFFYLRRRGAK